MEAGIEVQDDMKNNREGAFVVKKPDKIRRQLDMNEIEELRAWMVNNQFTRDNPIKNDEVRLRDIDRNYVRDSNGVIKKIQKKLLCVSIRALHQHCISSPDQGEYAKARDPATGKARITDYVLRRL